MEFVEQLHRLQYNRETMLMFHVTEIRRDIAQIRQHFGLRPRKSASNKVRESFKEYTARQSRASKRGSSSTRPDSTELTESIRAYQAEGDVGAGNASDTSV